MNFLNNFGSMPDAIKYSMMQDMLSGMMNSNNSNKKRKYYRDSNSIYCFLKEINDTLKEKQLKQINELKPSITLEDLSYHLENIDNVLEFYNKMLFKQVRIETKEGLGRVLVSNKEFKKFDIILVEECFEDSYLSNYNLLKLFYSLDSSKEEIFKDHAIMSRKKDNAFGTTFERGDDGLVFIISSMIEHSCLENCFFQTTDDSRYLILVALKDIKKSDRISICYSYDKLGFKKPMKKWRKEIKFRRGFDCRCDTCSSRIDRNRVFNCFKCKGKCYANYRDEKLNKIDIVCSSCDYKFNKKEKNISIQNEKTERLSKLNEYHYLNYNKLNNLDMADPRKIKMCIKDAEKLIKMNKVDDIPPHCIIDNVQLYEILAQIYQKVTGDVSKMIISYLKFYFLRFKTKLFIREKTLPTIERRDVFHSLLGNEVRFDLDIVRYYLKLFVNETEIEKRREYEKNIFQYIKTRKIPANYTKIEKALSLCNYCQDEANFQCSRCKVVNYCSRDCQKIDWKKHRKNCKRIN